MSQLARLPNKLLFVLIFLAVLPAVISLFRPGFFISDDGDWMVIRLSDFHRSFVSGQIPVRWAARLNHSYGYPVFNFSYPLSLYFGEVFHLLGFSFVNSVKLVFIFSFFLSAIFMYFFVCELWGKEAGLVAAIFYVYAPYRFLDVYVRGSMGEVLSFVFIPLIFWMIHKLSQKRSQVCVSIGALAYAGLIVSHNIMAMLFTPIILVYLVLHLWLDKKKKQLAVHYLLFIIFSLGLSCFFWLPALYDKQFTVLAEFAVAKFWEHFVDFRQLFFPASQVTYQLGLAHSLGVIFSLVFLAKFWQKGQKTRIQVLFFLLVFLGALFLILPFSMPVWKIIPILWWAQFPWRQLAITTFSSAVLSASLLQLIKPKLKLIFTVLLIILVILLNYGYAKPKTFVNRPEGFYSTNEATTTIKDEYMPIWVKEKPVKRPKKKVEILSGEGIIRNLAFNSKKMSFNAEAETELEVQINTIYFPGWEVRINDELVRIDYQNEKGLIKFKTLPGKHQIVAKFGETPKRLLADIISLVSFALVGGCLIKRVKSPKMLGTRRLKSLNL